MFISSKVQRSMCVHSQRLCSNVNISTRGAARSSLFCAYSPLSCQGFFLPLFIMEPKDCEQISQLCTRKKKQRPTETEEERRLRLDKRNKKDRERRARKRELKVDNTNSTDTKRVKIQEILSSIISERAKRASSVLFVFNRDFRYVRICIYIYICMWSYVKLCMRMLGGTYCGRGLMSTTF